MDMRYSASLLAMVAALGFADAAAAEEASAEAVATASNEVEAVVVTGYRASLQKAEAAKKAAIGTQETIVAEDIALFPEQNLADALQRIPGLTINRESGEGRQIQLRGLGPDFTQVTLNGMEALSTASSAYDSRGSVSRTRGFDFNVFASELFDRVDVYKTYSANLDEGGLAGTVALHTPRPFDYNGFKGAVSGQLGGNTNTDKLDRRFAALFSNTWGPFGALISVAYNHRASEDTGYDTVRWRQVDAQGADISALPATTQALINSKALWFPRGARPIIFKDNIERLGLTGALQFQPTTNLTFSLDLLYGKMDNDRDELHMQHATGTSTGMGCYKLTTGSVVTNRCSAVDALSYNELNEVRHYELSDTTLVSESDKEDANSEVRQAVLSMDWKPTERLTVRALLGHEDTDFIDNKAKVYMITAGDMALDFNRGFMGHNTYFFNTTDPSAYLYTDLNLWQPHIKNKFDDAKIDVLYELGSHSRLAAGLSGKKYTNEYTVSNPDYASLFDKGQLSRTVDPTLTYVDDTHPDSKWLSTSVEGVFNKFGISRWLPEPDDKEIVEEKDSAAYLEYQFHGLDLPIGSLRGDVGLRQYFTDITTQGTVGAEAVKLSRHYAGTLPAMSLAWDVTPSMVVRASVSKNVSRPALGSLSPSGTVQNDPAKGDLTISAGNPDLKPMTSTNFDVGVEFYHKTGYFSVAFFDKKLHNLIGSARTPVRYGDTGYPLGFLGAVDANGNPQNADTIYYLSAPINLRDASVKGVEIAIKRDFDFLPAPFDKLGLIANYTHVLGKTLYDNVQGSGHAYYKDFAGLSKNTANATLYYESERWGARISAAYRSHYILSVDSGNTDEDERGFHDTTFVDFTAHYDVTKKFRVSFDVLNMTDTPYEEYSDSDNRLYSATTSGVIYSLKGAYTF